MIMDGRNIKKQVLEEVKREVFELNDRPGLTVIQVGDDSASNVYIKNKQKMCEDIGYNFNHLKFNNDVTEEKLITEIKKLNADDKVCGILLQLPIPKELNEKKIVNCINPNKDVDGLTYLNSGKLVANEECLLPCTPLGILKMINYYDIPLKGKHVVIVGRSNLVGKPLANLLINKDATVTVCHSKTDNLKDITITADILVVAIGISKYITKDMVKEGAVVIDVGINKNENGICGDVNYDEVKEKVRYITPVPGGVGQLTIASLAENVLKAYKINKIVNE